MSFPPSKPMSIPLKVIALLGCLLFLPTIPSIGEASDSYRLRDYDEAIRANDRHKVMFLRAYMLGAIETHLLYSRMLSNLTSVHVLCSGNGDLSIEDVGKIFEVKMMTLRRRYGEDIMNMPIVKVVQMIVEEQYRCY